jgi:hypothetical protein
MEKETRGIERDRDRETEEDLDIESHIERS